MRVNLFQHSSGILEIVGILGTNSGYWILLRNGMLCRDETMGRPETYWSYRQRLASHVATGNKRLRDIDTLEWSCLHFLGNLVSMKFYPWSWSAVRANPEGPGQRSHMAAQSLKLSRNLSHVALRFWNTCLKWMPSHIKSWIPNFSGTKKSLNTVFTFPPSNKHPDLFVSTWCSAPNSEPSNQRATQCRGPSCGLRPFACIQIQFCLYLVTLEKWLNVSKFHSPHS